MTEVNELIIEKINSAEKLLVGIGKEFSFDKIDISEFEEYKIYKEKCEKEELETEAWILDIIRGYYINNVLELGGNEIFKAYEKLYNMIKDKDYYIVSTNYDNIIENAGFKKEKIVYPCGSKNQMQCIDKCCDKLWSARDIESDIINTVIDKNTKLKDIKKPVCSNCGREAVYNIVSNKNYLETGYIDKWDKYLKWTSMTLNKSLCILELGVGIKYPTVIRWPFEKICFLNNKAYLIRINSKLYQIAEELSGKAEGINKNSIEFLNEFDL